MARFCAKCGKQLKTGDKFCVSCGNPVKNAYGKSIRNETVVNRRSKYMYPAYGERLDNKRKRGSNKTSCHMKERSILLKITSIIMIIISMIGIPVEIFLVYNRDTLADFISFAWRIEMPGIGYYILSLIIVVAELAAGIVALMYRSQKLIFIVGLLWVALAIIGTVINIIITESYVTVFFLLFPILYFLGWYQSN